MTLQISGMQLLVDFNTIPYTVHSKLFKGDSLCGYHSRLGNHKSFFTIIFMVYLKVKEKTYKKCFPDPEGVFLTAQVIETKYKIDKEAAKHVVSYVLLNTY